MGTASRHRRLGGAAAGWVMLAAGLAGLAFAARQAVQPAPAPAAGARAVAARSSGSMRISNSRQGRALLRATNLAPGDTVSGTVRIANSGPVPGTFRLAATDLTDIPGELGGRLSSVLELRVEDLSAGRATLYSGALGRLRNRPVGRLRPGEAHTYRLSATLPDADDPAGINSYAGSTVRLNLQWKAGAAVAGRCAVLMKGTRRADSLRGTGAGERILGLAGNDRISGRGGADCLSGGGGRDLLVGGGGKDRLSGGGGRDVIRGGGKGDVLTGGAGKDLLVGGGGSDRIRGGGGSDRILARDGKRDIVSCGPGRDSAVVDRRDRVSSCERVKRRR